MTDCANDAADNVPTKRCMVVDDVRTSREMLRTWLEECQIECFTACDGQDAMDKIDEFGPNLILTDIEMPRLSGLELLQRVRASNSDTVRNVPVLVVTSLNDCQLQATVQALRGNGLLIKPLNKESIYSVVLEMLTEGPREEGFVVYGESPPNKEFGVISPTLRRLLHRVARIESARHQSSGP